MNYTKLSVYKTRYKKAKKQITKNRIFDKAFLNLPVSEFNKFLKWQIYADVE